MRRARPVPRRALLGCALGAACAAAGCSGGGVGRLRIMVPTAAGGGYDVTARTVAITLREAGLASEVGVFHLTGGAGSVALARLVHERGNDRLLLQMGLGLVGGARAAGAPDRIAEATPLARLVDEPEAVVVPAGSPYRSLGPLVEDWRRGRLTPGIGSSPGGPDHLALLLLAEAAGLDPRAVRHERYDGGGGLLAALIGRRVDFVVSGLGEYRRAVAAGELRVLGLAGPRRVPGIDAPTLGEAGLDATLVNWRGLLAPPGLPAGRREALTGLLRRLRGTERWQEALRANGWGDAFLDGADFGRFLSAETRRVQSLLRRFGVS